MTNDDKPRTTADEKADAARRAELRRRGQYGCSVLLGLAGVAALAVAVVLIVGAAAGLGFVGAVAVYAGFVLSTKVSP